jgi:hypothetical protein
MALFFAIFDSGIEISELSRDQKVLNCVSLEMLFDLNTILIESNARLWIP